MASGRMLCLCTRMQAALALAHSDTDAARGTVHVYCTPHLFPHLGSRSSSGRLRLARVWGFLNTKTYTLVVLVTMMTSGLRVPVLLWLLDWQLGLTQRVSDLLSAHTMHWLELFYTQHRIAHLPKARRI
mgnify:CR=1 FL=1